MPEATRRRGLPIGRIGVVVVRGRSMLPTTRDGDLLLVRWGRRPSVGDLVVLRLAALTGSPGAGPGVPELAVKRAVRLGDDGWWVERDSPSEGVDSWSHGAVAADAVLGVVLGRLWKRPGRLPAGPRR